MKYSSIPVAQTVVTQCKNFGISNIVISPGSRNAPLTISFTEDPYFTCFSIVDERCAAFFALGMAQNINTPVAVVCTSGSAVLNYYPAVAEAYYSEIPIIVISADRPTYKIGIGDGQTIQQEDVFKKHTGYNANLKQDLSHATEQVARYNPNAIAGKNLLQEQTIIQRYNEQELALAMQIAQNKHLPVHINVPFEEPLYEFSNQSSIPNVQNHVKRVRTKNIALERFATQWQTASKKMVIVGVLAQNTVNQELINRLSEDPSVLLLTETTSNIHHPNSFESIDSLVAPIELSDNKAAQFKELQPEILLTFGGLIVSKKIKAFLRTYTPKQHWHVSETTANDTFFCLTTHIKTSVNNLLSALYSNKHVFSGTYFSVWNTVKQTALSKKEQYLNQIPFSDFLAFHHLQKAIPKGYQLHLANSSTIRYSQLFPLQDTIKVCCNRGTSGIDGSTSTALGGAVYEKAPTILITGDLSFFYDSNALWNSYVRKDFRIILINNQGGGIFRILPGRENSANFERFFETKHTLNAQNLCEMYGFEYVHSNDEETLETEIALFFKASKAPKLLEVETPRLLNDKILMDYFRFIS